MVFSKVLTVCAISAAFVASAVTTAHADPLTDVEAGPLVRSSYHAHTHVPAFPRPDEE